MIYLGIDISKNSTGFGILFRSKIIKVGMIRNPTDQNVGEHLCRVSDHIKHLLIQYNVDEVILEDLFIQFNSVAKVIHPLHGVIKETVYRILKKECHLYPQQTWRSKLGIKNLTKKEREALIPEAKKVKGEKYITYHKHLCDVKHRVVKYVNSELDTEFTFKENDITDAIGLILAHKVITE